MDVTCSEVFRPALILGTAQLGMPYGIANTQGQPDRPAARRLIETALENGITHFDTAQAYGDSERVLGDILEELRAGADVRIASKLSAAIDPLDSECVAAAVEESFNRLHVERLWCMLLHRPAWLAFWDEGLGEVLRRFRDAGRIEALGVSLGTVNDAPAALAHPEMSILQAPCNAWDRRMSELCFLDAARGQGRLCCVRSVYLQGLLVMTPAAVASRLPGASEAAVRWWKLADELGASPKELAMRYALTLDAPLVVGAESPGQLAETARMARLAPLTGLEIETIAMTLDPVLDEEILEPWRWPSS